MEKVKDTNCRKILDKIQNSDENISESEIFLCFLFIHIVNNMCMFEIHRSLNLYFNPGKSCMYQIFQD